MNSVKNTLKDILISIFDVPCDTKFEDFKIDSVAEWDSMKQLTIITAIENEFDIFIDATDAMKLTSYDAIVEFLDSHSELE